MMSISQLLKNGLFYNQYYIILTILIMKALFIVGPSGSGKTTLSGAITDIYKQTFGQSTVTLVSLDPANFLSQKKDIQINQLVTVEDVMQQYQIGPNGAILYAMDFLYENIDWLLNKLKSIISRVKQTPQQHNIYNHLFVFDLPGQIQLYINSQSVRKSIQKITQLISTQSGTSPCLLQLFDCTYMHDVNQFISLCMMSLSTMINMQMPHINILNKIDIIKSAQNKPSRGLLNQYFRVNSATELVQELKSFEDEDKITNADVVAKVIDTYGQVSFMPCSIYKMDLVCNLIYELERVFGTLEISLQNKQFMNLIKEVDDFSIERAITNLENQYYEDEEQDMHTFYRDLEKQNAKN